MSLSVEVLTQSGVPPVPLLALDTTGGGTSSALWLGNRVFALADEGEAGQKASALLLPQVQALIRAAGIELADVGAIAFGAGPGAFTGLRTACAAAQGLGLALGVPLLAVSSLLGVAQSAREQREAETFFVAQDARMGEVYSAAFVYQSGWTERGQTCVGPPERLELPAELGPQVLVCGSAYALYADRLPRGAGYLAAPLRARHLLAHARALFERGQALAPRDARPVYVREKVAFTSAERAAMLKVATPV